MSLKRKFQGREQSKSKDESIYKETLYGTEAEVDAYIATLTIGDKDATKGYLHSWEKKQDNPAIWSVEVTYRVTYGYNTNINEEDDDDEDPSSTNNKTYSLSVRNIQIPIENHHNYKACWNHYLICLGNRALPAWWATATNTLLSEYYRQFYQWVSSLGEIPQEANEAGLRWGILKQPLKMGVSVYDEACFVVTEQARYKTSSDAGNHVEKYINTISDPPHKFGISGGDWKLDEASVEHDGKRWVAKMTWTHAKQWDTDIYNTRN